MIQIDIMAGFEPGDVDRVAEALRGGAVGVIPSDTVYGLAALALDEEAVKRVIEIKERPADKPLPIQVASLREANSLAEADGPAAVALAGRFWPGALTLVLPRRTGPGTHVPFQTESNIGIRIPDSMFCLALIEHSGFLVLPSANKPGAQAPANLDQVSPGILEEVDFVVNAGACPCGTESTVVDVTSGVRVLREGAITSLEIMRAVEGVTEDD